MKKAKKQTQQIDNLKINASFDDVIGLSVGKPMKQKKEMKQNVTRKKNKDK